MAKVKSIRALARGLDVLSELRAFPGASLSDLHARTGLAKATLLRLLKTLEEKGWVYCSMGDGSYWLGTSVRYAARGVQQQTDLAEVAGPVLEDLCQELVWPSDLAIFDGERMTIVETTRRASPFIVNRDVLLIRPHLLRSALGWAYIAFCPEAERETILRRLRRSPEEEDRISRDAAWVSRMIEETRAQGYGVREHGYWVGLRPFRYDISAIATPILAGGKVAGCINLLWVSGAMSVDEVAEKYLARLKAAADTVARAFTDRHYAPGQEARGNAETVG